MSRNEQVDPTSPQTGMHHIQILSISQTAPVMRVYMGGKNLHYPRIAEWTLANIAPPCRIILPAGYFKGYEYEIVDIKLGAGMPKSVTLELVDKVGQTLPPLRYLYDLNGESCKDRIPPPEIVIEAP